MDAIFQIVMVVVVIGGMVWLLGLAPINETFKKIGIGLCVIVGILWALKVLQGFF